MTKDNSEKEKTTILKRTVLERTNWKIAIMKRTNLEMDESEQGTSDRNTNNKQKLTNLQRNIKNETNMKRRNEQR